MRVKAHPVITKASRVGIVASRPSITACQSRSIPASANSTPNPHSCATETGRQSRRVERLRETAAEPVTTAEATRLCAAVPLAKPPMHRTGHTREYDNPQHQGACEGGRDAGTSCSQAHVLPSISSQLDDRYEPATGNHPPAYTTKAGQDGAFHDRSTRG